MSQPDFLIDALLPTYNGNAFLHETLTSLAWQTNKKYTLHIADDGSNEKPYEIISKFRGQIEIFYHELPRNMGISNIRNWLLKSTFAPYIAVIDQDDISHPQRFQLQLEFLEKNPEVHVVGSNIHYFESPKDLTHPTKSSNFPEDSENIKKLLLLQTCVTHPSTMIRRSFFKQYGYYDQNYSPAEDYEIWCRAAARGAKFQNLKAPLLFHRIHQKQTSKTRLQLIRGLDLQIKLDYLKATTGRDHTVEELVMILAKKAQS